MSQLDHQYRRLYQAVSDADRLLLVAHKRPDGDTLGVTLAFLHWCLRIGKDATLFCADLPSPSFDFLDHVHEITDDTSVFDRSYDLVIVFDSGDLKYAGVDELVPRLPKGFALINIDHHPTNREYGDLNIVELASSTSEIIYHFMKANGIAIDGPIATSLLTGICWDTSNFSNPLTSDSALQASSELVMRGARFNDMLRNVWYNKSADVLKLWGLMLSRLHHNKTYDVASSYFHADELKGLPGNATEVMVNFLSSVVGDADTILLLKDQGNGFVKGSFRGTNRDVSKLAKFLGGGGHKGAAGFTVEGKIVVDKNGRPRIAQADKTIEPDIVAE